MAVQQAKNSMGATGSTGSSGPVGSAGSSGPVGSTDPRMSKAEQRIGLLNGFAAYGMWGLVPSSGRC